MIGQLRLRNFKIHRESEYRFGKSNIIHGKNGS